MARRAYLRIPQNARAYTSAPPVLFLKPLTLIFYTYKTMHISVALKNRVQYFLPI